MIPFASCKAMSHSSRAHPSCSHQSPEECQGPAAQRISPLIPLRFGHAICVGLPSCRVTAARAGGRKMRSAVTALAAWRSGFENGRSEVRPLLSSFRSGFCPWEAGFARRCLLLFGAKCSIRNPSGRCVSSSCRDPTLFGPTIPAILANVSSSFSGSGDDGRNKPFCVARGCTGSADK